MTYHNAYDGPNLPTKRLFFNKTGRPQEYRSSTRKTGSQSCHSTLGKQALTVSVQWCTINTGPQSCYAQSERQALRVAVEPDTVDGAVQTKRLTSELLTTRLTGPKRCHAIGKTGSKNCCLTGKTDSQSCRALDIRSP